MGRICMERNYHDGPIVKAYVSSTDIVNTSDIGAIVQQSTNKVVLAVGGTTAATAKFFGYVYGFREGTTACTGGSSDWLYIRKFMPGREYEIQYSTVYSATHPGDTDIGKYVGPSTLATHIGGRLDMDTMVSSVATSSGAGYVWLRINGYSTARRMIYGTPAVNSSNIAW